MASPWVLLLAVLGGACALPAPAPLSYTEALAQAVDSYNQEPEVQNAFRLLSAEPEPGPVTAPRPPPPRPRSSGTPLGTRAPRCHPVPAWIRVDLAWRLQPAPAPAAAAAVAALGSAPWRSWILLLLLDPDPAPAPAPAPAPQRFYGS
uniref:Uncharacterized protein n=1 Tax=Junco hyemalis TaxID=40217 RepID=A0A8C5NPY6_JUNHY